MTLYLVVFVLLLFFGVPIAIALGLSSLVYLQLTGSMHLMLAFPQRILLGIDNFVLLAIPFFILAGNLMNRASLTQTIVHLAQLFVGRVHGGLAAINVLASTMFSGVAGAATAEAAAIGGVMIPAMKQDGYKPAYSAAITAAASLAGPLIPPSLAFIVYGVLTGTSIGDLFLAGILPAISLCVMLLAYTLWKGRRESHPVYFAPPDTVKWKVVVSALPALMLPVIIVVGIRVGIFTPTEAAVIACFYALFAGMVIYRTLSISQIVDSIYDTATMTAGIMLVIGMASMSAFIFGIENVPATVASAMLSLTDSPIVLLFIVNIVMLFFGLFLEPLAALILAMPILSALMPVLGMDPVQFGVMIVLNLMIGMITPPVGLVLFIVSGIARAPLVSVVRAVAAPLAICIFLLTLVSFVPALTLTLPRLFH